MTIGETQLMSDKSIGELLRGVQFFHDIGADHLERLAKIARPIEFPAHCEVFHEHNKSGDAYIIISGQLSLVNRKPTVGPRQLMQIGDGELVGWSPLLGRQRVSVTARTLTPVKALAINAEKAVELCREDPEFGFEFMHRVAMVLAERLTATRLQLLKLSGSQLPDVQIESD
jgi:CRP-like cAMP-binding protein